MPSDAPRKAIDPAMHLLVGECRRSHVVDPFQYYAEQGERVIAVQGLSHAALSYGFFHFDRLGNEIARIADLEVTAHAEPESAYGDEIYDHLLREMHSAALEKQRLWNPQEVKAARELLAGDPVVVGGCGRSGTTLLLSILGAHPAIYAFPDEMFPFFPYPFRLKRLLNEIEKQPPNSRRRWVEKTPKNVRAFGPILDAFDGHIKLIHIVRDGRDVVTSHHPNHPQQYWVSPERWVADVGAGLEYGEHSLLIRYEDLLQEPDKILREICDYIGEPFDERVLHPEEHSTVKTNVAWEGQSLKALHQNSIGRWKASVHAQRVAEFMDHPGAKDLMAKLGYR